MIALHPEPGARADDVRWVVPDGVDLLGGSVGRLVDAPGLGDLLRDGTLTAVTFCADCVVTTAGPGLEWATIGARVRTALSLALAQPGRWRLDRLAVGGEALQAAEEVLAGEFGVYVSSHGGRFELVGVDDDGAVHVRLGGACHGCPAAELSLRAGFERRLRARCPAARVA